MLNCNCNTVCKILLRIRHAVIYKRMTKAKNFHFLLWHVLQQQTINDKCKNENENSKPNPYYILLLQPYFTSNFQQIFCLYRAVHIRTLIYTQYSLCANGVLFQSSTINHCSLFLFGIMLFLLQCKHKVLRFFHHFYFH